MTLHLDWLKAGRASRGTPRAGRPLRIGLAWCLSAGAALLIAGCQSGPLSGCSSCGSTGFVKRTTARILHRDTGCCDSGTTSAPLEYGSAPATVVGPATTATPMYSSPASSGSVPSTVITPETPSDLNAVPKARAVPLPGQTSTSPSAGRASYTLRSSATRATALLGADRATRPASGSSLDAGSSPETKTDDAAGVDNPLDHLPPLSLPGEVTRGAEVNPPAPSASEPGGNPGLGPFPRRRRPPARKGPTTAWA